METLRFDLNKQKFGNPIIYGRVSDGNEYKKSVQFLMDGKPFDLTDWVVSFEGITAHFKNKVMDTVGVTLTDAPNGKFDYVFPNASFSQPGKYERAYFSAVKGDKRVTTADFEVIVLDYADIDAQEAEDFISEYNRLVVELNSRFNSAVDQMDADYDDLDQRVMALQQAMTTYEESVESASSEAIQAVNDALEQLGTYYTKTESDNRFLAKSSVATQAEAEAGTVDTKYMTPAKTKIAIDAQRPENDTGWVDLTFTNQFGKFGGTKCQYRVRNGDVEIRGQASPVVDIPYNTDGVQMFTNFPAEYLPTEEITVVCQGSSNTLWNFRLIPNDGIKFARYRNGSTNGTAAAGVWLPFHEKYSLD